MLPKLTLNSEDDRKLQILLPPGDYDCHQAHMWLHVVLGLEHRACAW